MIWVVLACILAALLLLSLVRVGVRADYGDGVLTVRLRIGPAALRVYPLKKKKGRPSAPPEPDRKPAEPGPGGKDMLALGRVKTAATLDELAKVINVPADNLKAAVAEYNKAASHQVQKDKFGFAATNTDDAPMTEGPWYACLKVPTVHHTMGGVKINTKAEVIGTNGKPISGLFAAGEVTGGIHGANRLGGNAIADVFTFGRLAGASAAKYAK